MAAVSEHAERERAIQALMCDQRVSEETARFIYALEAGEIPGDVMYVRDGEIVQGVSPLLSGRTELAGARRTARR